MSNPKKSCATCKQAKQRTKDAYECEWTGMWFSLSILHNERINCNGYRLRVITING